MTLEPTTTEERLLWANDLAALPSPWRERVERLLADVARIEAEKPQGFRYIQRPAVSVPAETRESVEKAIASAREKLGLEAVNVIWFLPFNAAWWDRLCDTLWRSARNRGDITFEGDSPLFSHPVAISGMFCKRYPRSIYVRTDLSPQAAAKVATHEAVHLWQFRRNPNIDFSDIEVSTVLEEQAEEAERLFLVPENV